MFKAMLIFTLFSVLSTGCVGAPLLRGRQNHDARGYEIGTERETQTGATMIWWQKGSSLLSYKTDGPIRPIGLRVPPASVIWTAHYRYGGTDCKDGAHVITSPRWYGGGVGIIVDDRGVTACQNAVIRLRGRFLRFRPQTWEIPEPVEFVRAPNALGVWHELVYTGLTGSTIRVTHREYEAHKSNSPSGRVHVSSYAREAFYLDLDYDLATSNELSFRDITIRVADASPARISYTVIADGLN